jgi:hypothetical protein
MIPGLPAIYGPWHCHVHTRPLECATISSRSCNRQLGGASERVQKIDFDDLRNYDAPNVLYTTFCCGCLVCVGSWSDYIHGPVRIELCRVVKLLIS